ncbi:MAG: hypothetical protein JXR94_05705, partial [Candidatus Hydrogenedentes bacterium]|nr:hypothetical protein [Candidatus Hydrogenedentota bacterium]
MSPVAALVGSKLRIARNQIASVRNESKLKVGVVSIAATLLWAGAYYAFYEGFLWLRAFGIDPSGAALSLGDIIMARLLSVFSLALFLMLIFSNVLIAYSTLYRSREVGFLLQAPVSIRALFLARFVECIAFSSWATAFLGSPLILAYGITTDAPWPFYLAAAAFYVPYVTVPAAFGAIILLLLVRVLPRLPRGTLIAAAALAVGGLFLYLRARLSAVELSEDTFLPTVLDAMHRTQSPLLPSYWASRGVLDAAEAHYASCLFHFAVLTANALMFTWVAAETAQRLFYRGWTGLIGNPRRRKRPPGQRLLGRLEGALGALKEPQRALVIKDIRLFWRDPAQWSQFVVFFGIMAIYVANLRNRWPQAQQEVYRSWIVCLNIGACTLILATLTSR